MICLAGAELIVTCNAIPGPILVSLLFTFPYYDGQSDSLSSLNLRLNKLISTIFIYSLNLYSENSWSLEFDQSEVQSQRDYRNEIRRATGKELKIQKGDMRNETILQVEKPTSGFPMSLSIKSDCHLTMHIQ